MLIAYADFGLLWQIALQICDNGTYSICTNASNKPVCADVFNRARCLNFDQSLHLLPYIVFASS